MKTHSRAGSTIALIGVLVPGVLSTLLRGKPTEVVVATYAGYLMVFLAVIAVIFNGRGRKRIAAIAGGASAVAAVMFVIYLYLVYIRPRSG